MRTEGSDTSEWLPLKLGYTKVGTWPVSLGRYTRTSNACEPHASVLRTTYWRRSATPPNATPLSTRSNDRFSGLGGSWPYTFSSKKAITRERMSRVHSSADVAEARAPVAMNDARSAVSIIAWIPLDSNYLAGLASAFGAGFAAAGAAGLASAFGAAGAAGFASAFFSFSSWAAALFATSSSEARARGL